MASQNLVSTIVSMLAAVLLFCQPLFAQAEIDQELLEELAYLKAESTPWIEAATKTKIPISKAPGSVTVITREQIERSTGRTIPDILRMVAGIHVRWNPMMQTITIRGFGQSPFTSRVLLLIDGVPYNSWNKGGFPQQPGLDFFPLENVKQLEIIRGPGSSLYGENAYWGVINIASIGVDDLESNRASVVVGERNTQSVTGQVAHRVNDDLGVLVSAKYLKSQYPTAFWFDDQNDPEVEGYDIFTKLSYKHLAFTYYRHTDSSDGFEKPLSIPRLPADTAFRSADKIEQDIDIAAIKYAQEFAENRYSVDADFSYARRHGSHCAACHARSETPRASSKEDHGYQATGDIRFGIHGIDNHEIMVGIEQRRVNAGDHDAELVDTVTHMHGSQDAVTSYNKGAIYFQDIISMMNEKLLLFVGGRYDTDSNPDLFNDNFSPRISAVYTATNDLTLRASAARAHRFPATSERLQDSWFISVESDLADLTIPFAEFSPNSELKEEKIKTFEFVSYTSNHSETRFFPL